MWNNIYDMIIILIYYIRFCDWSKYNFSLAYMYLLRWYGAHTEIIIMIKKNISWKNYYYNFFLDLCLNNFCITLISVIDTRKPHIFKHSHVCSHFFIRLTTLLKYMYLCYIFPNEIEIAIHFLPFSFFWIRTFYRQKFMNFVPYTYYWWEFMNKTDWFCGKIKSFFLMHLKLD